MGAVATAVTQLNTDTTALPVEQAQLAKDQQAITGTQAAITTDDAAVVKALQAIQVAGQPPVSVYFPPDASGVQKIVTLDPSNPAGFTVTTAVPA